jgi:aminopeptidase
MSQFDDPAVLERLAELTVTFAANVQPGQVVAVRAEIGKEALARAIAGAAYRAGAKFVDVSYFDLHVKRERILHAQEDSLTYVPAWYGQTVLELGRLGAARIGLAGPAHPGLMADLDPARLGRDQLPAVRESGQVVNERTTNWTIVPCPTRPWAEHVFPDLDPMPPGTASASRSSTSRAWTRTTPSRRGPSARRSSSASPSASPSGASAPSASRERAPT